MNNDLLDTDQSNQQIAITSELDGYLRESAKWGKFLSIVGFVMCAFMVLAAIFMSVMLGSTLSAMPEAGIFGAMGGSAIGILYVLLAALYFFPCLYLYRFAKNMKIAQRSGEQLSYIESFKNLKSMFKFMGIFMIVMLALYAVIFLGGLIAGLGAAF